MAKSYFSACRLVNTRRWVPKQLGPDISDWEANLPNRSCANHSFLDIHAQEKTFSPPSLVPSATKISSILKPFSPPSSSTPIKCFYHLDSSMMANFPQNPHPFVPANLNLVQSWLCPLRGRITVGGEPPRHHEGNTIVTVNPLPPPYNVSRLWKRSGFFSSKSLGVRVLSTCISPFGAGLYQFAFAVLRVSLVLGSPYQLGNNHEMNLIQHDESPRNLRACNCTWICWVMFLGFPLDYQNLSYINQVVSPYGCILH